MKDRSDIQVSVRNRRGDWPPRLAASGRPGVVHCCGHSVVRKCAAVSHFPSEPDLGLTTSPENQACRLTSCNGVGPLHEYVTRFTQDRLATLDIQAWCVVICCNNKRRPTWRPYDGVVVRLFLNTRAVGHPRTNRCTCSSRARTDLSESRYHRNSAALAERWIQRMREGSRAIPPSVRRIRRVFGTQG